MLPRKSALPLPALGSAFSPIAAPLRRSHVLYLLLLLTLASALGSWMHQLTERMLHAGAPPLPLGGGPQRPAPPANDAAAAAVPLELPSRLDRLEAGVEAVQRHLAALAGGLPAGDAAAAGTASSALPPPPPPPPPQQQQPLQQPPPAAPPRARPLVLGMAKGLDATGVYRFVRSLRTHSPDARIVIFTDQASLDASTLLPWAYEAYGVALQRFDLAALPQAVRAYHPSSYRWILMRDYLRALPPGERGGAVFFTDVRDTVFQGDLFARLAEPGLYVFQEQRPGTIAACGWNSGWVKDCFGAEGLAKVGHNVVSCSGTTAGSWEDALAYVELMGACGARAWPLFPSLPPSLSRTLVTHAQLHKNETLYT